jgi:sigma-B regulation protein RsbU (phosphoserine phosphatase)
MQDGPKAKEAIAAERLRTLLDNIPDLIYFKDLDGCFTQINHALARHFGLDDPELAVGKRDFDYFIHEHAQEAFEDEREIIRTGKALIGKEEKETFADGTVTWVTSTKMPLYDGGGKIIGTCGISRDITERKKAEERMELQSAALEAAANAILITDAQGVIEWANAAFTTCTGYRVAEVIGKTPKVLMSGKHDAKFHKNLWETIRAGKVWEGEVIDRRKDGRLFTGEMTITPMKDKRGEIWKQKGE